MDLRTDDLFQHEFIETLAKRMRPTLYLELGVRDGACIRRVARHAVRCVGVDINPLPFNPSCEFYNCTTEEFIRDHLPKFRDIELSFIDADHRSPAVIRDFEGILPYVAESGIILLHDTFPEDESRTVPNESGDSWYAASYIREKQSEYNVEIATIPVPPGISVIRKLGGKFAWMK